MDLLQMYHTVNSILDTIDFNALFAGFHKYRFALYTGKEIALDGQVIPGREDFRGNTAKEYEGEYIAIWNVEIDPVEDTERLACCLIHEMFHCHQFTNKETRFPSDFELLNYPDDIHNFIKKYNENRYLAAAFEQQDMELFRKFVSIRMERYKKYPAMVRLECKAETLEGMAEYINLKALRQVNPEKHAAAVEGFLNKLREESSLLFDVRRISYYAGAVYFFCLEKLGLSVRNAFDSELTAFEQNPVDTDGVEAKLCSYDFIPEQFAEQTAEKEEIIRKHMERCTYTECSSFICGYDPMNMFRLGDYVYCKHFVCLNENGTVKTFTSAILLQLEEGSNQKVTGYYTM